MKKPGSSLTLASRKERKGSIPSSRTVNHSGKFCSRFPTTTSKMFICHLIPHVIVSHPFANVLLFSSKKRVPGLDHGWLARAHPLSQTQLLRSAPRPQTARPEAIHAKTTRTGEDHPCVHWNGSHRWSCSHKVPGRSCFLDRTNR